MVGRACASPTIGVLVRFSLFYRWTVPNMWQDAVYPSSSISSSVALSLSKLNVRCLASLIASPSGVRRWCILYCCMFGSCPHSLRSASSNGFRNSHFSSSRSNSATTSNSNSKMLSHSLHTAMNRSRRYSCGNVRHRNFSSICFTLKVCVHCPKNGRSICTTRTPFSVLSRR